MSEKGRMASITASAAAFAGHSYADSTHTPAATSLTARHCWLTGYGGMLDTHPISNPSSHRYLTIFPTYFFPMPAISLIFSAHFMGSPLVKETGGEP